MESDNIDYLKLAKEEISEAERNIVLGNIENAIVIILKAVRNLEKYKESGKYGN